MLAIFFTKKWKSHSIKKSINDILVLELKLDQEKNKLHILNICDLLYQSSRNEFWPSPETKKRNLMQCIRIIMNDINFNKGNWDNLYVHFPQSVNKIY